MVCGMEATWNRAEMEIELYFVPVLDERCRRIVELLKDALCVLDQTKQWMRELFCIMSSNIFRLVFFRNRNQL